MKVSKYNGFSLFRYDFLVSNDNKCLEEEVKGLRTFLEENQIFLIYFQALNVIINMLGVFFMKEFKHLGVYGLVLNDEKILLVRKKGGSV